MLFEDNKDINEKENIKENMKRSNIERSNMNPEIIMHSSIIRELTSEEWKEYWS